MNIFVFLPCYNEELNIKDLIVSWNSHQKKLSKLGYKLKIYGIDDCSKDSTKKKIEEEVKKNNNVFLIEHKINKGLCGGLNTAITNFLKKGNTNSYMVLMDGDNTHDPKYIFDMIEEIQKGYDCVIASRYCHNSNIVGVAPHRKFLSDMAKYYYKFMLKVPNVQDYTCGYRIYSYHKIQDLVTKFGQNPIKEKSFACMMEFLYKLHLVGTTFSEIPFELRYDYKKGTSKMQVLKTMSKSLLVGWKLTKHKKEIK